MVSAFKNWLQDLMQELKGFTDYGVTAERYRRLRKNMVILGVIGSMLPLLLPELSNFQPETSDDPDAPVGTEPREGFDPAVSKLLADKFVCLYVDSTTAKGRALAAAFQVGDRGVVLSDRTGKTQAYSAAGTISRAELSRALLAYAAYAGYFQLLRATPKAVKAVTDLSGYVHQLADALVPSRPARKA